MLGAQKDERETLIIAQQDIVRRAESFDQLRFEQQRLGFRVGGDDFHRARLRHHALQAAGEVRHLAVIRHPVLQRPRLADVEDVAAGIEHAVDPRHGLSVLTVSRIALVPASMSGLLEPWTTYVARSSLKRSAPRGS